MLICPITVEVDFDLSVKVGFARFLHCKVTIFLFVINKYLVRLINFM